VTQHSRLQPGQPVAATNSAGWYPARVSDQHSADAGKDGRTAGEACAVLLAHVGGWATDASAVCGDVVPDRGAAASGRLTTSVIARESGREERRRRERCRRNRQGVLPIGRNFQNGTPSGSVMFGDAVSALRESVTRITVRVWQISKRRFLITPLYLKLATRSNTFPGIEGK